jgi:hypothetical protein
VGIERQRGVGEEARDLARELRLPAFVEDFLAGLPKPPLDHLVGREAFEEEVAGGLDDALDLRCARGSLQRAEQCLLMGDGEVQDAELPAHGVARELVCAVERDLGRIAQVAAQRGGIGRPEGAGPRAEVGSHLRGPR